MKGIRVSALFAWAPGIYSMDDWLKWARGELEIEISSASPDLKGYTDALFRRRLSQISRMTIEVVHEAIERYNNRLIESGEVEREREEIASSMPIVFASMRGELSRELSISRLLVSEREVLPAAFSLSVFNAPIALASIALHLHGGYTAVYAADGDFRAAFLTAAARLASCKRVLFVYADEAVPKEYCALSDGVSKDGRMLEPLAFACVIERAAFRYGISGYSQSGEGSANSGEERVVSGNIEMNDVPSEARDFLKCLIINGKEWGAR